MARIWNNSDQDSVEVNSRGRRKGTTVNATKQRRHIQNATASKLRKKAKRKKTVRISQTGPTKCQRKNGKKQKRTNKSTSLIQSNKPSSLIQSNKTKHCHSTSKEPCTRLVINDRFKKYVEQTVSDPIYVNCGCSKGIGSILKVCRGRFPCILSLYLAKLASIINIQQHCFLSHLLLHVYLDIVRPEEFLKGERCYKDSFEHKDKNIDCQCPTSSHVRCCNSYKYDNHNSSVRHLCVCKRCRDKVGELFEHLKKSFRFVHFTRREYFLLCGYITCNANDLQKTIGGSKSKLAYPIDDDRGQRNSVETHMGHCNIKNVNLPQNACYGAIIVHIVHPSVLWINMIIMLHAYIILVKYTFISLYLLHCVSSEKATKIVVSEKPKHSILYPISIVFIIASSKHLQLRYRSQNTKRNYKKTITKNALFEALESLQNGKTENTKSLLYNIIHHTGFRHSEVIHAYPVIRGQFSNELIRVGTLSAFPDEDCPSLIRLAASGFYFDGKGRELTCFSCGLKYDAWSRTTIPKDIHRQLSPECPYLKERFPWNAGKSGDQIQTNIEADSSGLRAAAVCTDSNSNVPALLASSSSVPVTDLNGPDSAIGDSSYPSRSRSSARGSYISSLVTSSSKSSGYSSGYESGNSSSESSGHASSNQTCSQLPVVTEADERQLSERGSMMDNNIQPDSSRNIPKMKYPEYKTKEKRLDTYKNWPKHLTFLYPRDLTECGFFYSNFGDCVRCFHCGIGLRNWEHDDNPWVEHARWSRNCSYLLQRKGQEFIDSVLSVLGLQTDAEIAEQLSNNASGKSAATSSANVTGSSASNDVRDPISHPSAQYVIKEGIFGTNVERLVKKTMNQLIQAHDWENITNDMLVNAMLAYNDGTEFMETRTTIDAGNQPQSNTANNTPADAAPMTTQANGTSRGTASVETDPEKVQKENEELKDLYTCKICLDERVGITFVPCGHLVTCRNCSPKIRRCPLCRTFIRGTIKTAV